MLRKLRMNGIRIPSSPPCLRASYRDNFTIYPLKLYPLPWAMLVHSAETLQFAAHVFIVFRI
jgi:hypothetical protein